MAAKRKKKPTKAKGKAPAKKKATRKRKAPAGAPRIVPPRAGPPPGGVRRPHIPAPGAPAGNPYQPPAAPAAAAAPGGMAENTHKAGMGTSAVIVTAAQKAAGVDPAGVARAAAAQPPNVTTRGGVTVQHQPAAGVAAPPVVVHAPTAAVTASPAVAAAPGVAPNAGGTNADAPVGGAPLVEAPDLTTMMNLPAEQRPAVHTPQPGPAAPVAQPVILRGMDAVSYAQSQGWTGVHTTSGLLSLEGAAALAAADPMTVWAEVPTGPAPEESPPGGAEGEEGEEDELGLLEDDTREVMAYARHAGTPLSVEIRGTATIVSPSRLVVSHQEDPVSGATFIHIEPVEDDGSDPSDAPAPA